MIFFLLHLGINASCVTHLESSKPELRQLRKVTDIDKRKLRGLANKEMVDEILKVKSMASELKKYQRGRGRGKKRSQIHEACEVFGQGAKRLRSSPLNGQIIEKTLLSGLPCQSPKRDTVKKGGKKSPGRTGKNGLTRSLLAELGDDEVSRLTRTTRMHGVLDECVSVLKEGSVWKITLCSEKKKNALTTEVGNFYSINDPDIAIIIISLFVDGPVKLLFESVHCLKSGTRYQAT